MQIRVFLRSGLMKHIVAGIFRVLYGTDLVKFLDGCFASWIGKSMERKD